MVMVKAGIAPFANLEYKCADGGFHAKKNTVEQNKPNLEAETVLLILSARGNAKQREAVKETWLKKLDQPEMDYFFAVGARYIMILRQCFCCLSLENDTVVHTCRVLRRVISQ